MEKKKREGWRGKREKRESNGLVREERVKRKNYFLMRRGKERERYKIIYIYIYF